MRRDQSFLPLTSIALMVFIVALNIFLSGALGSQKTKADKDPLYRFLGSFKEVIGDTLFLKADSYFHGGVEVDLVQRCKDEEVLPPTEQTSTHQHDHTHEDGSKHDHSHDHDDHKHDHPNIKKQFLFKSLAGDWVSRIKDEVKVTEHTHLEGEDIKEILPFMDMAIRLDPYNVTAILTCAYWLDKSFDKTDEAIRILKDGAQNNPGSWEIRSRLAEVYYYRKKDYAEVVAHLEKAVTLFSEQNSTSTQKRMVYYLLGQSHHKIRNNTQAKINLQKSLELFASEENPPIKKIIIQKLQMLG